MRYFYERAEGKKKLELGRLVVNTHMKADIYYKEDQNLPSSSFSKFSTTSRSLNGSPQSKFLFLSPIA